MRRSPDALPCALVREEIEARLSGSLPVGLNAAVDAHLQRCPPCRAEVELAVAIRRELSALPRFDAPPQVTEAIRRRVRGTAPEPPAISSGRSPDRRRRAWVAIAAAAAVALAAAAILVMPGRSSRPAQQASAVEIARATAEARLAFSLLADATATAQLELRQGVLRERVVAPVLRGIADSVIARGRLSSVERSCPTPNTAPGGSS